MLRGSFYLPNYTGPYRSDGKFQSSVEFGQADVADSLDLLSRLHDTSYKHWQKSRVHRKAADDLYHLQAKKASGRTARVAGPVVKYVNTAANAHTDYYIVDKNYRKAVKDVIAYSFKDPWLRGGVKKNYKNKYMSHYLLPVMPLLANLGMGFALTSTSNKDLYSSKKKADEQSTKEAEETEEVCADGPCEQQEVTYDGNDEETETVEITDETEIDESGAYQPEVSSNDVVTTTYDYNPNQTTDEYCNKPRGGYTRIDLFRKQSRRRRRNKLYVF